MTKQVLDINQMQHLQELGLELKEAMLNWARCVDNDPRAATHYGKWILIKGNKAQVVRLEHWEFVSAYTLQDVLDALPEKIEYNGTYFGLFLKKNDIYYFHNGLDRKSEVIGPTIEGELINMAYKMLCWAIENGFVETNKKNEK